MKTAVIVPTKNNVATIRQCLSSLLPYYYQGYISEIVVVDAHSTDGTLEVVSSLPVKLLCDEGVRPYFAREMGWRNTNGELILFIDADTYLGECFFPNIYDFFQEEQMGMVSPWQKGVVTNRVTRTIGEWWVYHADRLRGLISNEPTAWSLFQRLYQRVTWVGEKYATAGGPSYIVRRTCLEAVNGFECPDGSADILLSRRLTEKGWESTWWLDAPFHHYPVTHIKRLVKQRHHWGKTDAIMQRDSLKAHHKVILLISRLGTPLVGLGLAIRFKNPLHLFLFPLAHYAWLVGYIRAWLRPVNNRKNDEKTG